MTEVATDYTAKSMILGMFDWYLQNLYWELRMCVFLIVGMIAVGFLEFAATSVRDSYAGKDTIKKALRILEWVVSAVLAVIMVFWLYRCNVFNADAPGDAVADIHAFRTGGGKSAQRTDLPDRTDHFSWK